MAPCRFHLLPRKLTPYPPPLRNQTITINCCWWRVAVSWWMGKGFSREKFKWFDEFFSYPLSDKTELKTIIITRNRHSSNENETKYIKQKFSSDFCCIFEWCCFFFSFVFFWDWEPLPNPILGSFGPWLYAGHLYDSLGNKHSSFVLSLFTQKYIYI